MALIAVKDFGVGLLLLRLLLWGVQVGKLPQHYTLIAAKGVYPMPRIQWQEGRRE